MLALLARHEDVPVVLDGVVGAAREEARDERPLVAVGAVRRQEPLLLLLRERPAVEPRVQLVEPPQPAALTCSEPSRQCADTVIAIEDRNRAGRLPDLPWSLLAMRFQFWGPYCATRSLSLASSAGRQWPLECPLRLLPWPWPWLSACPSWNGDRAGTGGAGPRKQAIS